MTEEVQGQRPLAGLLVIDAVSGPLAALTRYLAELGADVVRVVPHGTADEFADCAANHGKRRSDEASIGAHLAAAHAVVTDSSSDLDLTAARIARPSLVTMAVSDFGADTEFSGWAATDPVLHALSGELSRSGIRGREPLLPPGELAYQCAATQAAFALVTALYRALRTGQGSHIDFSALDGAVQALDPGFGISGSATMGRPAHLQSRDRPVRGFQYPIIACADGYVRICLLAKRQWQGMFRWMGEPAQFASPEFDNTAFRYKSPDLVPAIAALFANRKRADLEREGQEFGVPIAAVLTFEECLASDHLRERQAFIEVQLPSGRAVMLPNGVVSIDGARLGPVATLDARHAHAWPPVTAEDSLPFAGLRVLDLGVIVVGAEQGRLLADGGADVVKVESRAYPDGSRQSYLNYGLSVSFAAGHRNKRSLGLNLRDPAGRDLFLELAAKADIVLSNFKPGTLEALGLDAGTLATINPALIIADSSAFGSSGPWSARMGYGPLVRAATGMTQAWRYPDDPESFADSVTIYPDHVAGRISAIGVVALLIRRLRTGKGGTVSVSQAEVMLTHFAKDVACASCGLPADAAPDWPWSIYRAAGEDEWCVVTVRDDTDWLNLASVVGVAGSGDFATSAKRIAAREKIDTFLAPWMAARTADAAMRELQAAGVPAARMLRVAELPDFDYYRQRALFRTEIHPYLAEPVIAERWSAKVSSGPVVPNHPAPLMGEHSSEIVSEWLDRSHDVAALVAAGVLEPTDPDTIEKANIGAPTRQ